MRNRDNAAGGCCWSTWKAAPRSSIAMAATTATASPPGRPNWRAKNAIASLVCCPVSSCAIAKGASAVRAGRGRRVVNAANVLRPPEGRLPLYFAALATRHPAPGVGVGFPTFEQPRRWMDQGCGALCAAKSRRRRPPGAGGHSLRRVPRSPDPAPECIAPAATRNIPSNSDYELWDSRLAVRQAPAALVTGRADAKCVG
jgi:hypothetical protein